MTGEFPSNPNLDLPDELRERHADLVQKLGPDFFWTKLVGIRGMSPAKIRHAYDHLLETAERTLTYVPAHPKKIVSEVTHDSHGQASIQLYGVRPRTVNVPAEWTVTNQGKAEINNYLGQLRKGYKPKQQALRKFFRF